MTQIEKSELTKNKILAAAEGEFSECWGAMCKRDDRPMQTVILMDASGFVLDRKTVGSIPEPNVEE